MHHFWPLLIFFKDTRKQLLGPSQKDFTEPKLSPTLSPKVSVFNYYYQIQFPS